MTYKIGIIDIGINNLNSLSKSLQRVEPNINVSFIEDVGNVKDLDLIFLPGVGNFGKALQYIKRKEIDSLIKKRVESGRPLIGICLGMQLLFDYSEESPMVAGLSLIPGAVKKLPYLKGTRVPNVGWSNVRFTQSDPSLTCIKRDFYFTHSYYVEPHEKNTVFSTSMHGPFQFASGVKKGNVLGLQFHPEKSGSAGLEVLRWILGRLKEESL